MASPSSEKYKNRFHSRNLFHFQKVSLLASITCLILMGTSLTISNLSARDYSVLPPAINIESRIETNSTGFDHDPGFDVNDGSVITEPNDQLFIMNTLNGIRTKKDRGEALTAEEWLFYRMYFDQMETLREREN